MSDTLSILSMQRRQKRKIERAIKVVASIYKSGNDAAIIISKDYLAQRMLSELLEAGIDNLGIVPLNYRDKDRADFLLHSQKFFLSEEWDNLNWNEKLGWSSIWKERRTMAWAIVKVSR